MQDLWLARNASCRCWNPPWRPDEIIPMPSRDNTEAHQTRRAKPRRAANAWTAQWIGWDIIDLTDRKHSPTPDAQLHRSHPAAGAALAAQGDQPVVGRRSGRGGLGSSLLASPVIVSSIINTCSTSSKTLIVKTGRPEKIARPFTS